METYRDFAYAISLQSFYYALQKILVYKHKHGHTKMDAVGLNRARLFFKKNIVHFIGQTQYKRDDIMNQQAKERRI